MGMKPNNLILVYRGGDMKTLFIFQIPHILHIITYNMGLLSVSRGCDCFDYGREHIFNTSTTITMETYNTQRNLHWYLHCILSSDAEVIMQIKYIVERNLPSCLRCNVEGEKEGVTSSLTVANENALSSCDTSLFVMRIATYSLWCAGSHTSACWS